MGGVEGVDFGLEGFVDLDFGHEVEERGADCGCCCVNACCTGFPR